jgi:glycine oxidase
MTKVTIYGAGIFGLSIAFECLKRGATVTVIDPYGVATGSSGGLVGALAPHVPENWNAKKAFQFESLLMAEGFWAEVAKTSGRKTGYTRQGRIQPLADDAAIALAKTRGENAKTLWQGRATWSIVDHATFAPFSPTGLYIYDTLSAHIHPRTATHVLAEAVKTLGGRIVAEAPPDGILLYATGVSDLVQISEARPRLFGNGVKGQALLLDYDARGQAQIFADTVHIVPHNDGTTAIGSTSERDYSDPTSCDAQLETVLARAIAAVPALKGAPILERWAGVRPRSRSRAPVLGKHPLHEDAFIANGGFKIGFGLAPKIAQVMADLILDNHDTVPDDFRPEQSF